MVMVEIVILFLMRNETVSISYQVAFFTPNIFNLKLYFGDLSNAVQHFSGNLFPSNFLTKYLNVSTDTLEFFNLHRAATYGRTLVNIQESCSTYSSTFSHS